MRGENAEVIVFLMMQLSVVVAKYIFSARLNPCNCHLMGGELLAFVKAKFSPEFGLYNRL